MAYTAYEVSSAGTTAMRFLESMQRQYTIAGTFTAASTPALSSVEAFLTNGSAEIAAMLASYGYSQSQTDVDVLTALERFNVYSAAELIEASRASAGGGFPQAEPLSRINYFAGWRTQLRNLLKTGGLEELGAGRTHMLTAGGISISDKEALEEDSDFEPYKFFHDEFQDPNTTETNEATQRAQ